MGLLCTTCNISGIILSDCMSHRLSVDIPMDILFFHF